MSGVAALKKKPKLPPLTWQQVLRHQSGFALKTVKKYFEIYRLEAGIPYRCAMDGCPHPDPMWNGQKLDLALDHVRGANRDHSPKNLRYVCPNCHTQTDTYAGRNRGRTQYHSGGYEQRRYKSPLRDHYLKA